MREERGADPRPACSAGRTGGPLHAVLVTHPPRLLHARTTGSLRAEVPLGVLARDHGRTLVDANMELEPFPDGPRLMGMPVAVEGTPVTPAGGSAVIKK